jgi:hypothetical protein
MVETEYVSKDEIVLHLKEKVVSEEIELTTAAVINGAYKTITVDCSGVYTLNHPVLAKLYMLKLDLATRHKNMRIKGCSSRILNLFRMISFDKLVQVIPEPGQDHPSRDHPPNGARQ